MIYKYVSKLCVHSTAVRFALRSPVEMNENWKQKKNLMKISSKMVLVVVSLIFHSFGDHDQYAELMLVWKIAYKRLQMKKNEEKID